MNILSKVKAWNVVAESYASGAGDLFPAYSHTPLMQAQINAGTPVADIACGPRTPMTLLAGRGAKVAAVDSWQGILSMLGRRVLDHSLPGVSLRQADGQNLPFPDDDFDRSFSRFGLMFFAGRARGRAEVFRTLCPGACL